jgi:hypothetical protein
MKDVVEVKEESKGREGKRDYIELEARSKTSI